MLKFFKIKTATDAGGAGSLLIKVPGTFTGVDPKQENWSGRNILKATGWFATPVAGDYITNFQLVDHDNILGMGADTVLNTWSEDEVGDENKGLYIPYSDGHCIIVPPQGTSARVPSGLYLKIIVQKGTAVVDDFYVDIEWDDLT